MSRDGTPRLYMVTTADEMETPLFCSESTAEVAEFMGTTQRSLVKRLSLERNGKGSKKFLRYKVVEIRLTKEEMEEVTT